MAVFETWVNRDLKKIMTAEDIRGTVFTLDNLGNKIGVRVFSDGQPVTLSGSVNGYCILADGTTVPVAGTRSGNEAYIILPQSAYAVPGMIRIAIKLTDGSAITTLAALIGSVALSRTDNMITPSQQIITDWSQQIAAEMQAVEDASAAQDAKISDLKQALSNNVKEFHYITLSPEASQGGISNITGNNTSSSKRIRTGAFFVKRGIQIVLPSGMKGKAFYYNASQSYDSGLQENQAAFSEGTFLVLPYDVIVRLVFGYTNESDILPSAISGVSITRYEDITDKTLTESDYPADAKAVGNVIEKILTDNSPESITWKQGTINNNGILTDAENRCRATAALQDYDVMAYIKIGIKDGYSVKVVEYNQKSPKAANFEQVLFDFTEEPIYFLPVVGHLYCIVIRKTDDSNITPSGLPADCISIHAYGVKTEQNEDLVFAMDMIDIISSYGDDEKIVWEQGTLRTDNGRESSADNRIRSKYYMTYDSLKYLYINCPKDFMFGVRIYERSDDATLMGLKGFKTGMNLLRHEGEVMYKLILKKVDESEITPNEVPEDFRIIPVYNPYWSKNAHGNSVATIFTHRNNPTYIQQIISVAESYYTHRNDQTGNVRDMVYGYNTAVRQDTYTNRIDCSTFVGLVLRGLFYEQTQYYTHVDTPASTVVANPDYIWSFNPQYYDYYSEDMTTEPVDATRASQLGEWMIDMGWKVPKDKWLLNLEPGDIIFYSRKTASGESIAQPDRFLAINHIAICVSKAPTVSGDGYYEGGFKYKHELLEVTDVTPCVRRKIVEESWDDPTVIGTNNYNTISLICRPDLGSI